MPEDLNVAFSVIIPVYNKLPHLSRSISSVINQSYPHWELILIDNGSTDGSSEFLQKAASSDIRIKLISATQPSPGGYHARNIGINAAKHEWVAFLDADDEWKLNKLEEVAIAIRENPDCDIISSGWREARPSRVTVDDHTMRYCKSGAIKFDLNYFITHPQLVWTGVATVKRTTLLAVGAFDERWKMGADLDLWLRILMTGCHGFWINKVLATYYMDSVNMVTQNTVFVESPIFYTTKKFIKASENDSLTKIKNLKKFSNRVVLYTIRKRLKHNLNYKSLIFKHLYFSINLIDRVYFAAIIYLIIPYRLAKVARERRIL